MAIIPRRYGPLTELAVNNPDIAKPAITDLLKQFDDNNSFLHSLSPSYYIIDCMERKYIYIDSLYRNITGYSSAYLMDHGPRFFTELCNPDDLIIYNEQIFPAITNFLQQHCFTGFHEFIFTFNYRLTARSGRILSLVQRTRFISMAESRVPLIEAGFILDITDYKADTSIYYKSEKLNLPGGPSSLLSSCIYYPDQMCAILSKREMQILKCIYKGMSSKEIADKCSISINTINNHRRNMLQKTKTNNTSDLLRYSFQNGLL